MRDVEQEAVRVGERAPLYAMSCRAIRAGHPVGADEPTGGCVPEEFLLVDDRGLVSEIGGHLMFPFGLSGDLLMSTSSAQTSRLPSPDRPVDGVLHPSFPVVFEAAEAMKELCVPPITKTTAPPAVAQARAIDSRISMSSASWSLCLVTMKSA